MSEFEEAEGPQPHSHSWIRLCGYRLAVIPFSPFRAWRLAGSELIEIEKTNDGKFVQVIPDAGGYKSKVDQATTRSLFDVVSIESSAYTGEWRVEATSFTSSWPPGFDLYSSNSEPMSFWASDGRAIFVQFAPGDFVLKNARPDLRATDEGILANNPWIEYEYAIDGRSYVPRHVLVSLEGVGRICVTLQAPTQVRAAGTSALEGTV